MNDNGHYQNENVLQDCLEQIYEHGLDPEEVLARYPDQEGELRSALQAVQWMVARRRMMDPRPGFVAASRRRLVARLTQVPHIQPSPSYPPHNLLTVFFKRLPIKETSRVRLVLGVLLVVVLLANFSAINSAAKTAFPGDIFYGVKRTQERVSLALASSPEQQAELHILFAQRRLSEMASLVLEGRFEHLDTVAVDFESEVRLALKELEGIAPNQPQQAEQLALMLENTVFQQTQLLAFLVNSVPNTAKLGIFYAIEVCEEGGFELEEFFNSSLSG